MQQKNSESLESINVSIKNAIEQTRRKIQRVISINKQGEEIIIYDTDNLFQLFIMHVMFFFVVYQKAVNGKEFQLTTDLNGCLKKQRKKKTHLTYV